MDRQLPFPAVESRRGGRATHSVYAVPRVRTSSGRISACERRASETEFFRNFSIWPGRTNCDGASDPIDTTARDTEIKIEKTSARKQVLAETTRFLRLLPV